MTIFEVLGVIWTVLMGLRTPMLLWECRTMYALFNTRYTRKQSAYVVVRWVFIPGILLAPGLFMVEGLRMMRAADIADLKAAAIHIDRMLQQRAQARG